MWEKQLLLRPCEIKTLDSTFELPKESLPKRKPFKRGLWSVTALKNAINDALAGNSIRKTARKYGISETTVRNYVKALKTGKEITIEKRLGRFRNTFGLEHEAELVKKVEEFHSNGTPLKALFSSPRLRIRGQTWDSPSIQYKRENRRNRIL